MQYFEKVMELLALVDKAEAENVDKISGLMCQAILDKKAIYVYGAGHAGIITEEMFYRAGGLMTVNPIFGTETLLFNSPISHTSRMERINGYGKVVAQKVDFTEGDILIVHSVSGRNPAGIDVALTAKEKGVITIALTSIAYSKSETSRHDSGKRLFEVCDYVLDNHGDPGDALCEVEGLSQRMAPSSTVVGAALVNSLVVETVKKLRAAGVEYPPVFYSANQDGGDERNRKLYEEYKDGIRYKL